MDVYRWCLRLRASVCVPMESGKLKKEKKDTTGDFCEVFQQQKGIERIVMGLINETNKQQNDDEMEVFFGVNFL